MPQRIDASGQPPVHGRPFSDTYGREVTYLRLSVTDRCDLRCTYCMAEQMAFLSRGDVLSLEELYRVSSVFIENGVRKIRVTGGEPLVRKNVMSLFGSLARHLESGELDELTLTTNGTLLSRYADELAALGVRRVNVSLDTLNPERYAAITRWGRIERVLEGLAAAQSAGLHIKLNAVAMRGAFEAEVDELISFAHQRAMDLTLIEEMPLGETACNRQATHLPLNELRAALSERWTLTPLTDSTGGPARYVRVEETGGRLGFITPLSCNFCASCNRVRVSCSGKLYTCMGDEGSVDLRNVLRETEGNSKVETLIREAIHAKPTGHSFCFGADAVNGISRHMSVLGG